MILAASLGLVVMAVVAVNSLRRNYLKDLTKLTNYNKKMLKTLKGGKK